MHISIVGYGKMGKEIEKIATERGHNIVHRITSANKEQIQDLTGTDVVIEFTAPDQARANFSAILAQGLPLVTGTTGWYNQYDEVKKEFLKNKGRFFYATNFSVGVNIAFAANRFLAKIMEKQDAYVPHIHEIHHTEKKDAPSGTAITFAEGIMQGSAKYSKWVNEPARSKNELSIISERAHDVPGTHRIEYHSDEDSIILEHIAKGRKGFALGSVLAAEFLQLQEPGIYTMNDLLKIN